MGRLLRSGRVVGRERSAERLARVADRRVTPLYDARHRRLQEEQSVIANEVLASEQFKWFYWAGPLFAFSVLMLFLMLGVGYYVKVLRPKWRGREVK